MPSQSRLLTLHSGLYQLSVALAGGFVSAFLLKVGFTLPETVLFYAMLLIARLGMRFCTLYLVRRLGYKYAAIVAVALSALQFVPLTQAQEWPWLIVWIAVVSLAESTYWPIYHSACAVVGYKAFGRELGIRSAVVAIVNVIGPAVGGFILAQHGPAIEFSLAALIALMSIIPLVGLKRILAGPVPEFHRALKRSDAQGIKVFAADGWLSAGLTITWPMILFLSLGARYDALGLANAGAGLAGAIAGLYSGAAIDRGTSHRAALWISIAIGAAIVLRSFAAWTPLGAAAANATGAVVTGFYVPVLMSVMYDGAKRSAGAYAFHFAAEAGWDLGAAAGCLIAAVVASSGVPAPLAILPSLAAVLVLYPAFGNSAPHSLK